MAMSKSQTAADAVRHLLAVRWIIPLIIMLGVVPHLYAAWILWRVVSVVLPLQRYHIINAWLFAMYQRLVLFFYEHYNGIEVLLYGDMAEALTKKEKVLYMSNHQSTVDWVIAEMIAARQGSLNACRYVIKSTVQMVPMFGHMLYEHGCIYVKRGSFKQDKMIEGLEYLRDNDIPNWLIIFPESTRFDPKQSEAIQRSQKYAADNGLTQLNHHYTPRSLGMHLILDRLRSSLDAIYDVTVIYENTVELATGDRIHAPQMAEFMLGRSPRLHLHLNRIPMSQVPTTQDGLQQFLDDIFVRKDKMLEAFYQNGEQDLSLFARGGKPPSPGESTTPPAGKLSRLSMWQTAPIALGWTLLLVPTVLTSLGRSVYWQAYLCFTLFGYGWMWVKSVA